MIPRQSERYRKVLYLFVCCFFLQNLEKQLQDIEAAKAALDTSLLQCQGDVTSLRADLENSRREKDESENRFKQQVLDRGLQLLGKWRFYKNIFIFETCMN